MSDLFGETAWCCGFCPSERRRKTWVDFNRCWGYVMLDNGSMLRCTRRDGHAGPCDCRWARAGLLRPSRGERNDDG